MRCSNFARRPCNPSFTLHPVDVKNTPFVPYKPLPYLGLISCCHTLWRGGWGVYKVNTDVLSWLLRPVPFVAGLPAPAPSTSPATTNTPSNALNAEPDGPYPPGAVASGAARNPPAVAAVAAAAVVEVAEEGADVGGGSAGLNMLCRAAEEGRYEGNGGDVRSRVSEVGEGGGGGADPMVLMVLPEEEGEEGEGAGAGRKKKDGDATVPVGEGAAAAAAVVANGSEERRAVPVVRGPAAECAKAIGGRWAAGGGGGGGDGGEREKSSSSGRAGFHSYDETHQVQLSSSTPVVY